MKSLGDVEALEKLLGQLSSLHSELLVLVKKSPNDPVNKFKIKIVNQIVLSANKILGKSYRPLDDFDGFDIDDVPTNSDVTVVLSQYAEQAERLRSDNVVKVNYRWFYIIGDEASDIESAPPSRIGEKK